MLNDFRVRVWRIGWCFSQGSAVAADKVEDLVDKALSARLRREIKNEILCRTAHMSSILRRMACACSGEFATPACFDTRLQDRGVVEEHSQHSRRLWSAFSTSTEGDEAASWWLQLSATRPSGGWEATVQGQQTLVTPNAIVRIDLGPGLGLDSDDVDVSIVVVPWRQFQLRSSIVNRTALSKIVVCPPRMVSTPGFSSL